MLGLLLVLLWSKCVAATSSCFLSSVVVSTLALDIRSPMVRASMFGACWSPIETVSENPVTKVQPISLEPNQSNQLPNFVGVDIHTFAIPPDHGHFPVRCEHIVSERLFQPSLDLLYLLLVILLHFHIQGQCITLQIWW